MSTAYTFKIDFELWSITNTKMLSAGKDVLYLICTNLDDKSILMLSCANKFLRTKIAPRLYFQYKRSAKFESFQPKNLVITSLNTLRYTLLKDVEFDIKFDNSDYTNYLWKKKIYDKTSFLLNAWVKDKNLLKLVDFCDGLKFGFRFNEHLNVLAGHLGHIRGLNFNIVLLLITVSTYWLNVRPSNV